MSVQARFFKIGEVLFEENSEPDCIYIIKSGSVSIRKKVEDGQFIELNKVHSGEVIGELSFFDRSPRSASAVAVTETETMVVPYDNLEKIYEQVPDYWKKIFLSIADRLRRAGDLVKTLQK